MANQTNSNPISFDTVTGATLSGLSHVRLIQWIDDNADIADNGNLIMSINGVTLEATVQRGATPDGAGAVLWQIGPFNPGMPMKSITVSTLSAGAVLIWRD